FFTFLDEPVVLESLAQPQPSKENDENEHRNDRDIIRLGQDLQKIMPTSGFFHKLSTRKIDVILKKVFDILAKVNVTPRKNPRVFPFSSPIFGRDPSRRHDLPHDSSRSPNYSIRPRQHVGRNRQTDLFGRFQIDDELEFLRLLHRKVSRLPTFQYFVHVRSGAAKQIANAYAVGHEPTFFDIFWSAICRWEPALYRQVQNLLSLRIEDGASQH